jgi:hypothetical protein
VVLVLLFVVMLGLRVTELYQSQTSGKNSGEHPTPRSSGRESTQEGIKLNSVHEHSSRESRLAGLHALCWTVALMAGGKIPLFAIRHRRPVWQQPLSSVHSFEVHGRTS